MVTMQYEYFDTEISKYLDCSIEDAKKFLWNGCLIRAFYVIEKKKTIVQTKQVMEI